MKGAWDKKQWDNSRNTKAAFWGERIKKSAPGPVAVGVVAGTVPFRNLQGGGAVFRWEGDNLKLNQKTFQSILVVAAGR